ncbi:VRR-NUC domain-containing protein [Chromobacterium sp. S0633]|uniref:VRR-NUC domain-containing protein n=1 Tax=Chromobacterium sp. S0633 TaxID=2957805 RepID=UPI0020A0F3BE|nr:VRR-NUC domain-containing protein [Chromobacterium sp. S0633]MCP1291078.1 VRR-NUC domain-containing protein [Chromobacterium sp. S0633]
MANYQPAGGTMTIVEERPEYAMLPHPGNKPYLTEKADVAILSPKSVGVTSKKTGRTYQLNMRQITMSTLIRIDENSHDFKWFYKAEVSFDLTRNPPTPFLSSSRKAEGPNRQHTINPFPKGLSKGYLRRPDLVIVKDKGTRWPGRAATDHDGVPHGDNLARVVEVKFPGDELGRGQEDAYKRIAGGDDRFTVLDVIDKRKKRVPEPKKVPVFSPQPKTKPKSQTQRVPAPIYSPVPVKTPGYLQDWGTQLQRGVAEVWSDTKKGMQGLAEDTQAWLEKEAAWLLESGRWVRDKSEKTWTWVNAQGKALVRWTEEQLKAAWAKIERYCDIAWNEISQIQWGQILLNVGKVVVGIVLVVAAVALMVMALPAELVAAFIACVAILGGATVSSNDTPLMA